MRLLRHPIIFVVFLVLLLVPSWSTQPRLPLLGDEARFTATPVMLVRGRPTARRLGALVFERGYRLRSADPAFGGFSSLFVEDDRFTLLNDGGNFITFRLDSHGALSDRRSGALPGGPGIGWDKSDRDSESMTRDPKTGAIWVGFENSNEIWCYRPGFTSVLRHAAPRAMHKWPTNGGPEAMVRQADGSFLVLSETGRWPKSKGHAALFYATDPTRLPRKGYRWSYLPPLGFFPTDIAQLPDGRMLLLNRQFNLLRGFRVTMTVIDPRAIAPGKTVVGREIARFAPPVLHDNFEGIAVVREKDGGTAIWIVSDDNQSVFQQSLLLKFRLDDARMAAHRH